jgi:hypothetical protein
MLVVYCVFHLGKVLFKRHTSRQPRQKLSFLGYLPILDKVSELSEPRSTDRLPFALPRWGLIDEVVVTPEQSVPVGDANFSLQFKLGLLGVKVIDGLKVELGLCDHQIPMDETLQTVVVEMGRLQQRAVDEAGL